MSATEIPAQKVVALRGETAPAVEKPGDAIPTLRPDPGAPTWLRPVKRRKHRTRLWIFLSAILCIGGMVGVAAYYYYFVAADQYVSEVKFAVRAAERAPGDPMAGIGSAGALAALGADSFMVTEFIGSRQIVDEIDQHLPLRPIFRSPLADFVTRLGEKANTEELVDHWRKMVTAKFDVMTGIVTLTVRAYTPQESLALARAVIQRSEEMFVRVSERSRRDQVRFAEDEVTRAEAQAQKARNNLRAFRERERILDANRAAESASQLIAKLKEDLSRLQAQLTTMSTYLGPSAPQMQLLKSQIKALEDQIRKTESASQPTAQGKSGADATARVLSDYEGVQAEVQFAEKAYQAALDSLQRARASADRRSTYLSLFVEPTMPVASLYPERGTAMLIVVLLAFTAWFLGLLIISSIRDHLP